MSDALNPQSANIRVYACGGGGTNIAYEVLEKMRAERTDGFARIDVVYLDTSRSNIRADIPADRLYLLEDKDGSGQIRSENNVDIADRIPEVLKRFPPADLNIVLGTLSGGSGSVFSPVIASELLSRKASVVVIGIGDERTAKFAENTINSIKSLEGAVKVRGAPLALFYRQNSAKFTRSVINLDIAKLVVSLAALFSKQNRELDSKDLFNWLFFANPKVSSYGPQLVALTVCSGDDPGDELGNVISVATLSGDGQEHLFPIRPDIQFTGFLPDSIKGEIRTDAPHHFVISDGIVHDVVSELKGEMSEYRETSRARHSRKEILTDEDRPDGNTGLVV